MVDTAGTPIADLVSHRASRVAVGGLKGQISYDDVAFRDVDQDIQHM